MALRDLLGHGAKVVAASECAFRGLFQQALTVSGYGQSADVARDEATASKLTGKNMEGDGCILSVSDASGIKMISSTTIKYAGAKQVGIVAVLQRPDGTAIVIGLGHFKSGTKSVKEEIARAAQMKEIAQLIKAKVAEHNADAGFMVGDCNAALHDIELDSGAGDEAFTTVAPLLLKAAEAEGFKPVLPKEADAFTPGSKEWIKTVYTSHKERCTNRTEEAEDGGASAPAAKRHRKLEYKTAANDWLFEYYPDPSKKLKFHAAVGYLLPPQDEEGPCTCKVSRMATYWSDHTSLFVRFGDEFSVAFLNLLARGLDDEMLGYVAPSIHPDSEAAAVAAVKAQPRITYKYDVGGESKPNSVVVAPYTIHPDQSTYHKLALAMEDAWHRSVMHEATQLKKKYAEVLKTRSRTMSYRR